jgi:dihydrofolate reductase
MITIISAMTKSGVIGKGNALPWHIPDELKNFRRLTQDSTVIMGRRTFESIGRPLPKRNNIVLSLPGWQASGVIVCQSIDESLEVAQSFGRDIFVIGGAQTYVQFLPLAHRLLLSYIKQDYEGDIFFPDFNLSEWNIVERVDYPEFEVVTYERLLI